MDNDLFDIFSWLEGGYTVFEGMGYLNKVFYLMGDKFGYFQFENVIKRIKCNKKQFMEINYKKQFRM